ncbi:hypothetical protein K435DRAFT_777951 [Dendrothele bispora CBS 962.96]|uniref:Protein kinase domain-containing protein n=1 Tax=Dendrothele bispora (strain CBS 962.96) TaxID=1314807 RepID=A0A4S8M5X7_DENBC|nr:hypothetical protein K435DRAFT_777951 [Dendrothele bispora CBS 962.96]
MYRYLSSYFTNSSRISIKTLTINDIKGNQHQHYDTTSRTEPSQTAPTNDGRTDNDEACNISETPSVPGSSSPLRPTTSAATRTVLYEDVEPVDELYRKAHYHVHSGRMQERLVVMKVFHGPRANALLRETLVFSRRFLHPHILRPVGISSPTSDVPFIVFDGACKISIQNRIASALSDNLQPSIQLGIRIVSGLATGLDYLFSSCEVPPDFSSFKGLELYITGDDNIKISFGPFNPEVDRGKAGEDERLKIFNDLCSEVFKQANHLLYQDVPVEQDPSGSSLFKGKEDNTSTGSTSAPEGGPTDNPSAQESSTSRKTRIELAWKTPPQTRATVAFIARHYKQYLERLRIGRTTTLQQLPAQSIQNFSSIHHRCSGYRKEEIVLTPHIPESAIISYTAPFLHEICSICGKCVQEEWPPQWLSSAMHSTQAKYPNDKFELTLRKLTRSPSAKWYIKCVDCPGKLYKIGPGETLSNFEIHPKNRQHRQRVDERVSGDSDW